MSEDACCNLVVQLILRFCVTAAVIFTESHVVPRRATIIRHGRRLQNWLHLPEALRIFSETNPGMTDGDIRLGVAAIGISAFLNTIGLMVIAISWPLWHPAFFCRESLSFCTGVLAWLKFALARRRRQASQAVTGHGSIGAGKEDSEEDQPREFNLRDPELQRRIDWIWIWPDIWIH